MALKGKQKKKKKNKEKQNKQTKTQEISTVQDAVHRLNSKMVFFTDLHQVKWDLWVQWLMLVNSRKWFLCFSESLNSRIPHWRARQQAETCLKVTVQLPGKIKTRTRLTNTDPLRAQKRLIADWSGESSSS